MKLSLFTIIFLLLCGYAGAQIVYPGGKVPADTPALFAENTISDGVSNRDFTISPAGDELFFTMRSAIIRIKKVNNK